MLLQVKKIQPINPKVNEMNRQQALKALVEAEQPIAESIARISQYEWDSEDF